MSARRGGRPVAADETPVPGAREWRVVVTGPGAGHTAWITANKRQHWAHKARLVRAWRENAQWATRRARLPQLERARIVAHLHFPDARKRDANNYADTLKAIVDGVVVDAGLLPDDDSAHLIGPDLREGLPVGRGRPAKVTLVIIELPVVRW